jgi:hypothetical protein
MGGSGRNVVGSPHGKRPLWRITSEHGAILKRVHRKYINCDYVNWTAVI